MPLWLFLRYKQQLVQKASGCCALLRSEIHYGGCLFLILFFLLDLYQLCSSKFKSFSYLYDEDHFIHSLSSDVVIVHGLPKDLREARKKIKFPTVSPRNSATPEYYIKEVLPRLVKSKVLGIIVNGGNCLQVSSETILTAFCFHSLASVKLEPFHAVFCSQFSLQVWRNFSSLDAG
jgi:hypothetical protein